MEEAVLGASGKIALDDAMLRSAQRLAAQDFSDCEKDDFCGDAVRDILLPEGLGWEALPLPVAELKELGLEPDEGRAHLYATCGVDSHTDNMDGLSVCVVLHSDGFTFRQGRTRLELRAGDWFIFDDRFEHEVEDASGATTLLVVTCPLCAWTSS